MLIVIIGIALVIIPAAGLILYFRSRKLLREAKNYERSFKMVPLLIHLPPLSDDIDSETRDSRDVADENISRATTLYNIIASTSRKGFKSKFYGQRHIGIEIVAVKGFVHFYAVVPLPLIPVVEQAITSAYPSARLEEVADHNIFSPVGKLSGTSGGEIVLKEAYAYPIGNYQEIKRDTMQSLLNSLSSLQNDDGVGIQILFRPAKLEWIKHAKSIASKKRKGTDKKSGGWDIMKNIIAAPTKPPEYKDGEQKPLSNHDQAIVDAIDEKTRSAGFEVLIRVVASSNLHQRAMTLQSNVVATFSLFDAPGRNGFKFVAAKDIEKFVQGYIMRLFPQESDRNILNTTELATLFHFPDQKSIPTTQLERQQSKQADGPRNMSDKGLVLGYNVFRGVKKRINLDPEDRRRHMYIIGQTGTGKSVFLDNCAVQDMLNGDGFCFIDPHGTEAEKLLALVPKERTEDVIYFCPSDTDYPFGLNLFECRRPEDKDFLIQETINILYALYDPNRQGMIGARFEQIFRNSALLLMADPEGGTFIDIPKTLIDPEFVKYKLQFVTDQNLIDYWTKEWPAAQRSNDAGEVTSWVASKFGAFLGNEMMRNIIGQTKSSFNLREIMDQRKILIVNLSKGQTGELNSKLLGMIFVMQFQAAAMSRADTDNRPDFCLYVDEFQNYSTESFATILSEARKFGLNLVVANQFTTQLTDEVRGAVFGNVGTIINFRVGREDAEVMEKIMQPIFSADDLQRIPNLNMVCRTLVRGVPMQPFSMQCLPFLNSDNKKLATALKQLSAAKYGRPKAVVEAEIMARLATKPVSGATSPTSLAPSAPMPSTVPPKQPSFLDDWLAKRSTTKPTQPSQPLKPAQPNTDHQNPTTHDRPVEPANPQNHPQPLESIPTSVSNIEPRIKEEAPERGASDLAGQIKASMGTLRHEDHKPSGVHHKKDEHTVNLRKIENTHTPPKPEPVAPPNKNRHEGELAHNDVLQINR